MTRGCLDFPNHKKYQLLIMLSSFKLFWTMQLVIEFALLLFKKFANHYMIFVFWEWHIFFKIKIKSLMESVHETKSHFDSLEKLLDNRFVAHLFLSLTSYKHASSRIIFPKK